MSDEAVFLRLRVLILRQDELYAAQCIDHDIVAQGSSIQEVKKAFERTIVGQVVADLKNGLRPLAAFPPAPERIQRLFEKAERLEDKEPITLPPGIPPAYMYQQIPKEIRIL